ncbi:MAG: LacI family DNA-binding transcriptional regulator [Dactylosporangium sp.]|nr:LacI family transcriptional regulator [Dactylosporangium sp.]NNJ59834.1 LacI family DNA-binding transcriptional regulator [Dactylosporangium sp.]
MAGQDTGPATVTLADVARRARVSPATASRVINGSAKRVTSDLKERVLRAVQDLRYVPNAHAQHLARSQRSAVGVIVHDVSDPYFAEITRGLQRVATDSGRLLLICNSYGEPDRELAYVELLRSQQVHALVLAGSGYHDVGFTRKINGQLEAYAKSGGHISVIGRHDHVGSAVVPDNEHGGFLACDKLYELGHTRIGVVAGPRVLTTTTDRLAGIRRAARQRGTTFPAQRIVHTDFSRDGGASATRQLLETFPDLTALIALNDSMAVGALAALRASGQRVPDGISVIGFDDMPVAEDVTPTLTTVRLPLIEMGARAMAIALDEGPSDRREAVEVSLVWRESCGACR